MIGETARTPYRGPIAPALSLRQRGPDSRMVTPRGLMRKCACGKHTAGGACTECASKQAHQGSGTRHGMHEAASVETTIAAAGQPLTGVTREAMEQHFGHDFSGVRVHADGAAAGSADAVDAHAYTVGSHIVFGAGQYAPQTLRGQGLLAHELAHVVQQQGALGAAGESLPLEREADQAALRVLNGQSAAVAGRGATGVMRQPKGSGASAAPKPVPPRVPTATEQKVIEAARGAAAVRTQLAYFGTAGIGPGTPDNRQDIADYERRQRARQLATRMFDWDPPNMEQVGEIVNKMINHVAPGTDYRVAGAGDPECGTRSGYVVGHRLPIVLCPGFFRESPEQRVRTLIHEAAHVVGIGKADTGESYCVVFDCEHGCGGFDSADSWAQYVHCLSGQAADKPQVIRGKAPGSAGKGGQP